MHDASPCTGWLPAGKTAAVCFSVDDVHPATSADACEAGGGLGDGALGRVEGLPARHPALRVSLFVTPDRQPYTLVARRSLAARLPVLRDHVHWVERYPDGYLRVDRHPAYVDYLNGLPRAEAGRPAAPAVRAGLRPRVQGPLPAAVHCRGAPRPGDFPKPWASCRSSSPARPATSTHRSSAARAPRAAAGTGYR